VGNMSVNVCAKFRCALQRIKKPLGIFRELMPTRRTTTRVDFWDPPSRSKKRYAECHRCVSELSFSAKSEHVSLWALMERKVNSVATSQPSGNTLFSIKQISLCQAQLILGLVTDCLSASR